MPSTKSIYSLIDKKFRELGLDPNHYTIGDEYKDDSYSIREENGIWIVGSNDRGKTRDFARFDYDIDAAEFLILKLGSAKIIFPEIDWTEYASLP